MNCNFKIANIIQANVTSLQFKLMYTSYQLSTCSNISVCLLPTKYIANILKNGLTPLCQDFKTVLLYRSLCLST